MGSMDRYTNIRPWTHNRVVLKVPDGKLDYVNASAVVMPASDDALPSYRYIAMQGPTDSSLDFVWRMVAEQTTSPVVIVQLTTMVEGNVRKCSQYFPPCATTVADANNDDHTWVLNRNDAWDDGWAATLTCESTELLCDGAIHRRKLLLDVDGDDVASTPRTVWHLLYLRWPDFGAPALADIDSFFALMNMSRALANNGSIDSETNTGNGSVLGEPRIIHCSAGVGRTGTFICLEYLIRQLATGALDALVDPVADADADADADPIYDTVDLLRQQRPCMVQSLAQFLFIYQVMRKLWCDKHGLLSDQKQVGDDVAMGDEEVVDAGGGQVDDAASSRPPVSKKLEVAHLTASETTMMTPTNVNQ